MQDPPDPQLRVLVAASLIDALPDISEQWSRAGGSPLNLAFDGSSRLATQIDRGAPADVFLSADRAWAQWLEERGRVGEGSARRFATNRLAVLQRRGSTSRVRSLADLEASDLTIALAGENVPAGRYAETALREAGVWEAVGPRVIRGGSVLTVVEWVRRGEVDLGIAYRTDAVGHPELEQGFLIPPELHPPIEYVAVVTGDDVEAGRFVEFLESAPVAASLAARGFTADAEVEGRTLAQSAPPLQSTNPVEPGSAIRLSLLVALLATVLGSVPAVALGWLLARRDFAGKVLVSTAVLAPLVLPPVVTGYLLLSFLGREGWGGRTLAALGVTVPFTLAGAVLAATVVGFPLFVLAARSAFEGVDRRYEDVAATLGYPPLRTFSRVALPLARSGILAGAVLAFARALGEFGATIVLAGNLEGATRTIPLAVYTLLEAPGQGGIIWILVGASVLLSLGALALYESLSRSQRSGGRR